MNRSELLARIDAERRTVAYEGTVLEQANQVTRWRSTDGTMHGVIAAELHAASVDAVINEQIHHYSALGVSFEWKVYAHDHPADLRDRLSARGFEVGQAEVVMVKDLFDGSPLPDAPAEINVRQVRSAADIEAYRTVAGDVFGKDYSFTATQLADALAGGLNQHRGYLAHLNGTPAGIARLYVHPQSLFGGLYGGGTHADFRGRGVYRALLAARARDASAAGARYLVIDALPTSRPIVERLGFVHLTDTWPCVWTPPGTAGG
jgi:GNAT superfamily N-acetyltransferase